MVKRIDDLSGLQNTELQRAVLETLITMHLTEPRMQGNWTHIRAERRGSSVRWMLLDADDDSVRAERDIQLGSTANEAMIRLTHPFVAEQHWELCRVTTRFSPAKMTIDVLTDTNAVVATGELIDLHLEEQVRQQLALMMENK